jgi:2-iminobutanoate/2-iminopropanoate deaminase
MTYNSYTRKVDIMSKNMTPVRGALVPGTAGPYSAAISWEKLVFVSGLLAINPDGSRVSGDIREQGFVVLRNLKIILEAAGSGLEKLLSATVYLLEIEDLGAFNEVYEEFIKKPYPARSVAGISLPSPFRVELSAIAFKE